jgi:predicted RecA/RadA family phage recombinase
MAVTFRNNGDSCDYTPTLAVTAGDVIVLGSRVCVAKRDIAANELGALARRGVFAFPKASGSNSAIDDGTKLYWDPDAETVTPTAGSLKVAGYAANGGASDDDETVDVELSPA